MFDVRTHHHFRLVHPLHYKARFQGERFQNSNKKTLGYHPCMKTLHIINSQT
jgi:hypothetical protein